MRLVCRFGSSVRNVTVVGGIHRRRWAWIVGHLLDGALDSVGTSLSVRLVWRLGSSVGIVTVVGGIYRRRWTWGIYRRRWTWVVGQMQRVVGYRLAVGDWR